MSFILKALKKSQLERELQAPKKAKLRLDHDASRPAGRALWPWALAVVLLVNGAIAGYLLWPEAKEPAMLTVAEPAAAPDDGPTNEAAEQGVAPPLPAHEPAEAQVASAVPVETPPAPNRKPAVAEPAPAPASDAASAVAPVLAPEPAAAAVVVPEPMSEPVVEPEPAPTAALPSLPAPEVVEQLAEVVVPEAPLVAEPDPIEPEPEEFEAEPEVPEPAAAPEPVATLAALPEPSGLPDLRELPSAFQASLPPISVTVHVFDEAPDNRMVRINRTMYREGDRLQDDLRLDEITPQGLVMTFRGTQFHLPL